MRGQSCSVSEPAAEVVAARNCCLCKRNRLSGALNLKGKAGDVTIMPFFLCHLAPFFSTYEMNLQKCDPIISFQLLKRQNNFKINIKYRHRLSPHAKVQTYVLNCIRI